MTHRKAALGVAVLVCLTLSGCGPKAPVAMVGQATLSDSTDPRDSGSEPLEDATLPSGPFDELPLQFPRPTRGRSPGDSGSPDDVGQGRDATPPGVIETLRGTIEASPVFEQAGATTGLLDSLDAAQQELARMRRDNRRAIREANRQVRTAGALSPHLVLITLGDLAYADPGCCGGSAATPHLDAFAAQGMRFTSFYASSTDPRAARWSLLTGLNTGHAPAASGGDGTERFALSAVRTSIADVLWRAGYATSFVGVWRDRELPLDHGSDEWTGLFGGSALDPFPEYLHVDATRARLVPNAGNQNGLAVVDFLFDEALAALARGVAEGRPAFVHLAVTPQLVAVDATVPPADVPSRQLAALDARLGRLLARLERWGLASQCCVVVAGESAPPDLLADPVGGPETRAGGFRTAAHGLCEGNLRIPLLVRWPGRVAAGSVSDHVCAAWDILPTLAELAAAQRKPQQLDGVSFAAALTGRPQREHALLYWETRHGGFGQAVRKGRWKGVRAPGQSTLALYDLITDPSEQTDLSMQRPDVVEQLVVRRR